MSRFVLILFLFVKAEVELKSLYKIPAIDDFFNHTTGPKRQPIYARIEDFPYVAKLHIDFGDTQVQCGGTLINSKWVLTAAHCVSSTESAKIKKIYVCMGIAYLPTLAACTNKRTVKLIARPITRVDLAMLRLTEPFTLSESIKPLNIVKHDLENITTKCKVMGWGWMQPGFASPNLLQADVTIVDYCFEDMICVKAKSHAPCRGDSGGPLICDGILVGVASVGENANCDKGSGITAYVPVWRNIQFITKAIEDSGHYLGANVHFIFIGLFISSIYFF